MPAREIAHVGWWEGAEFLHVPARLRNLSSSGLAVTVDEAPEDAEAVWVCLVGEQPSDWVRTKIARKTRGGKGERQIGLAFYSLCPLSLFRSAIWGTPSSGTARPAAQDGAGVEPILPPPPPRETAAPPRAAELRGAPRSESTDLADWTFVALAGVQAAPTLVSTLAPEADGQGRANAPRTTPLAWLVPALMQAVLAVLLALVAIETFSDVRILDPLINCLMRN